ncbi:hypothetical protein [Lysobacter gummosus]|uniref:hypothetical protein n=1 Tax=Lysobacter gummosus TaxID=262324 RepID=UPI00362C8DB1
MVIDVVEQYGLGHRGFQDRCGPGGTAPSGPRFRSGEVSAEDVPATRRGKASPAARIGNGGTRPRTMFAASPPLATPGTAATTAAPRAPTARRRGRRDQNL